MTRSSRGPRRNRCEGREIIIDDKIVRKVAEQYLRYGDSGLGEADCWRFAIETVGGDLTQEQFTALAEIIKEAECPERDTQPD